MPKLKNADTKCRLSLKSRFLPLISSLLALSLSTSCGLLPEEPVYERAPTIAAYTPSPYEYTTVKRGDIEIREHVRFEYVPTQEASLSFSIGGLLFDGIYVKQGSQVSEGQVLAQLEAADVDQMYADAFDGIDRLELELEQLIERQALARLRQEAVLSSQGLSAADQRQELAALDETHVEARQQLEDQLYLRQLALDQMEDSANERRIYAPFDATVAYVRDKRNTDRSIADEVMIRLAVSESSMFVGKTKIPQYFTAGTEMILTVGDDEMPVIAVDPVAEGLMEESTEETDAVKDDEEVIEVEVYLRLNMDSLVLESGTKASISVLLDASRDTLLIDEDALHFTEDQAFVYVESEDGLREVHYIDIGLQNGDEVEVLSGLEEGEKIILD